MANVNKPYLCGGVFFTLLVEASRERISPSKSIKGMRGNTKDHVIMQRLVELGAEGYVKFDQEDFSGSVSKYKNCGSNYGKCMPFHKTDYIDYVHEKLTDDTDRALYLMTCLLDEHFVMQRKDGSSPIRNTARKILYVVDKDISPDTTLLCGERCKPIKKRDLVRSTKIELQSFLLGVWDYIISECHDNKSEPYRNTLEQIYEEKETANGLGVYNENFAKGLYADIEFVKPPYGKVEPKIVIPSFSESLENDEYAIRIDGEVVENGEYPEVIDDRSPKEDGGRSKYDGFVNNGIFIDTLQGNITYKER